VGPGTLGTGTGAGPRRRWRRVGDGDGVAATGVGDATGAPDGTGTGGALPEGTGTGVADGRCDGTAAGDLAADPVDDAGTGRGVADPALPDGDGVALGVRLCASVPECSVSELAVPWPDGAASAAPTPPATTTTAAGAATHHCLRDNNLIRNLRFGLAQMPAPVSTAGRGRRLHRRGRKSHPRKNGAPKAGASLPALGRLRCPQQASHLWLGRPVAGTARGWNGPWLERPVAGTARGWNGPWLERPVAGTAYAAAARRERRRCPG